MLESTANIFSDGLQRELLLTGQGNFGSGHKWILSAASRCVTCLYRQRILRLVHSSRQGNSLFLKKRKKKRREDRFDRKMYLPMPGICAASQGKIPQVFPLWHSGFLQKWETLMLHTPRVFFWFIWARRTERERKGDVLLCQLSPALVLKVKEVNRRTDTHIGPCRLTKGE